MHLLGIDIGTTNTKAGLFRRDGTVARLARRPTPERRDALGAPFYDPDEVWETVAAAIREAMDGASPEDVAAVGVAGMAETGLLLDRKTLRPRTPFVPWHDDSCAAHVADLRRDVDPEARFVRTGLRPSFKHGLVKILWLRVRQPGITDGALWLSAPGYVALRLTGEARSDPSLAARTYAFRLDTRQWDAEWLGRFGLDTGLFPPLSASGAPIGTVMPGVTGLGLAPGTPVAVAGHDHLCAALAAGAIQPGLVLDSMGTAEALMGAVVERPLGAADDRSGLSYGPHVVAGMMAWHGGLPSSGGSLEWARGVLGGAMPMPYDEVARLVEGAGDGPTGILYFPFLSGRGAPRPDPGARGAFIGLEADCSRGRLLKAVLEGTSYEMEAIRRSAEAATGAPIRRAIVVGGGARNPAWLRIKADVSGCPLDVPDLPEAAALGAAMAAGISCGVYADEGEAVGAVQAGRVTRVVEPDARRHALYRRVFNEGYLPLQDPLRCHFERMADTLSEAQT